MTYSKFKEIIDLMIKQNAKIHSAYDLKIDLIDFYDESDKTVHLLWSSILNEYGLDWLNWYLYEKNGISGTPDKKLTAHDLDGTEICKNVKGLYQYLTKYKYFKI